MLRFYLLLLVPLLALFGCSAFSTHQEDQAHLALACEMAKCECRIPRSNLSFSPEKPALPVEWRSDGAAHCPAGYLLTRVE